jgi:hypothetical protein
MALKWSSVTAVHVERACATIRARARFREKTVGLILYHGAHQFSAKEVLGEAYRMANGLPPDSAVRFSSGEPTLRVLRKLGFRADRLPASQAPAT